MMHLKEILLCIIPDHYNTSPSTKKVFVKLEAVLAVRCPETFSILRGQNSHLLALYAIYYVYSII